MAQRKYQKTRTEQTGEKPKPVPARKPRPKKKPPRPAGQEGKEPAIESPGPPGCAESAPQGPVTQPVGDKLGSPRVHQKGQSAERTFTGFCFYCGRAAVTLAHHADNGRLTLKFPSCEQHERIVLWPSGRVSLGTSGKRFSSLHDLEVWEGRVRQ